MTSKIVLNKATKQDYKNAIEAALELRKEALQKIVEMTMDDFDDEQICVQADRALYAYRHVRKLKAEMRANFPATCTCQCADHKEY